MTISERVRVVLEACPTSSYIHLFQILEMWGSLDRGSAPVQNPKTWGRVWIFSVFFFFLNFQEVIIFGKWNGNMGGVLLGAGNKRCLVCREFRNNNRTKYKSICYYLHHQQFSTTSVIKHTNLVDWTLPTNPTHEPWYTTALIPSFSCVWVWLFVTPWTIACQAPPSMGFSRQEY